MIASWSHMRASSLSITQGRKYKNYQGPKEHAWREFRPRSRSNGSIRTGEDYSHRVQFASLANSNVTTPGIQTPVMSIQESRDQGLARAAMTETGGTPNEETASVPTALNQTAPPSYGTAKKDAPATIPTPMPDSKVEPEGVDLDQTMASIASGPAEPHNDTELSGVMKDFPEIPTCSPVTGTGCLIKLKFFRACQLADEGK